MFIVSYAVWVERKVSASIQDRHGPNRVGPFGLFQPIADATKPFRKEELTPAHVRIGYSCVARAFVMIPRLLTLAMIPRGSNLAPQQIVIGNLNVGSLHTFGIVSSSVYGSDLA